MRTTRVKTKKRQRKQEACRGAQKEEVATKKGADQKCLWPGPRGEAAEDGGGHAKGLDMRRQSLRHQK